MSESPSQAITRAVDKIKLGGEGTMDSGGILDGGKALSSLQATSEQRVEQ